MSIWCVQILASPSSWQTGALVEAYHFAGALHFHLGNFQVARDWHQQSLKVGNYGGRYHSEGYGFNMGVFCRVYLAHCEWQLGYPDRALRIAEEGLGIAREVAHPFSIAFALDYLSMLHQLRREPEAALRVAREAGSLCAEYRFAYYGAWSALVQAWGFAEQAPYEEGL